MLYLNDLVGTVAGMSDRQSVVVKSPDDGLLDVRMVLPFS
jgi:hypothetical protein